MVQESMMKTDGGDGADRDAPAMIKVEIYAERCKSCGLCIIACPQECLERGSEMNSQGFFPVCLVNQEKCRACALCALVCPDVCFEIYR